MRPVEGSGDLTLTARPATPEVFAPFGTLVRQDETASIGGQGPVLLSMSVQTPGPRRVTNLNAYPEARRVVMALRDVPMWIVVVPPADEAAPAMAFSLPADHAMVINAGVWHAGPWPLSDTTVCELLETREATDRLDRRAVHDVAGVDGIRVVLPEEPGARPSALDLGDPAALRVDAELGGRLTVALLQMEGLDQETGRAALQSECVRVTDGLRALWGHVRDVADIPGVQTAREHLAELGAVTDRAPWPDEELLGDVLQGVVPEWATALESVRALCFLRMRVPLSFLDADRVQSRLELRVSLADAPEALSEGDLAATAPGTPVLRDARGQLASPVAVAPRSAPSAQTRRLLALLWLPSALDEGAVDALVNGVATAVRTHCGGRLIGRRVF